MPALGKGLGSLIPNKKKFDEINGDASNLSSGKNSSGVLEVDLKKIKANPWQPRSSFDRDNLEELAESIKQHGILQPLLVIKKDENYQLIAGERRLRAAEIIGLKTVPIIIKKEMTDRNKLELSIIENIQRQNLNPLETAKAYQRLMQEFALSYEQIAKQLGKSVSTVANFVRLLKLPSVIQDALRQNKITFSHAKIILSYATKNEQIKIFKKILKNDLSVKQLEEVTKKIIKSSKKINTDPVISSWEDKITRNLGAKTTIKKRGEKGFVKIDFFSTAELKNILDKLQ